jgi:REP-associated tyrosine transposase
MIYHVLNRGNGRLRLFHKESDYDAFEGLLVEALKRYPVELLTYCLMPNHWHLVLRPRTGEALGRLMGWVGVTHVRRHHEQYHRRGTGHLYQGRYKSFPVAEDDSFLTLCRYVDSNALRAKLVERAERWRWSGLWRRAHGRTELPLSPWPVERPRNWTTLVNGSLSLEELGVVRDCVGRGRPLGEAQWVQATAARLGLEFTLRGPGRPRKTPNNQ